MALGRHWVVQQSRRGDTMICNSLLLLIHKETGGIAFDGLDWSLMGAEEDTS